MTPTPRHETDPEQLRADRPVEGDEAAGARVAVPAAASEVARTAPVTPPAALRTPRRLLRRWRDGDLAPFAAVNADAQVMEHFPAALSRAESDAMVARIRAHFDMHGFGLWAVELVGRGRFIGFTGLSRPGIDTHFTPCVEVGWRLAAASWGRGYATEAAAAAVRAGFARFGLEDIVSFTVPANRRSRRVMERLGMRHDPAGDFEHPRLPVGHPLRRHVLYRLDRGTWERRPPDAEARVTAASPP